MIDGRLTAFFIPHADLKVFLDADERVRAQRIFKDRRDQEKNTSMEEAVTNLKKREVSEKKRYMKAISFLQRRGFSYDEAKRAYLQLAGQ